MAYTICIDHVEKTVSVTRRDGAYVVTVDGREHLVADVTAAEGTLAFLVDRQSHIAHVSNAPGGVRLSLAGRNYTLIEEEMDTDRPGRAAGPGGDGNLEAPMPGSIVSVNVSEGDAVTAGAAVVVLESMKMQNEITAPIDGVVKRVHCAEGDQVGFGDVLVEIAADE